ncbi:MAG: hypothetical protein K9H65_02890 [Bacteroidales bacterium]|nr:hypothetical protein [Bacteroidales bacterium]
MHFLKYIPAIFLLLSMGSCTETTSEPELSNPYDPENPAYEPPHATITESPEDGKVLNTDSIVIQWEGVNNESQFRYQLENYTSGWSEWQSKTSVTFAHLDEGDYRFKVMEQFVSGDRQEDTTSVSFSVDAVEGPSVLLEKQLLKINTGNHFSVQVKAEEVEDLMGLSFLLTFDPSLLQLENISEPTGFLGENADGTSFLTTPVDTANQEGAIEINASRLGGDPQGVSGTGKIAVLNFSATARGHTAITFKPDNCSMRDSTNKDIAIHKTRGSTIVIE